MMILLELLGFAGFSWALAAHAATWFNVVLRGPLWLAMFAFILLLALMRKRLRQRPLTVSLPRWFRYAISAYAVVVIILAANQGGSPTATADGRFALRSRAGTLRIVDATEYRKSLAAQERPFSLMPLVLFGSAAFILHRLRTAAADDDQKKL